MAQEGRETVKIRAHWRGREMGEIYPNKVHELLAWSLFFLLLTVGNSVAQSKFYTDSPMYAPWVGTGSGWYAPGVVVPPLPGASAPAVTARAMVYPASLNRFSGGATPTAIPMAIPTAIPASVSGRIAPANSTLAAGAPPANSTLAAGAPPAARPQAGNPPVPSAQVASPPLAPPIAPVAAKPAPVPAINPAPVPAINPAPVSENKVVVAATTNNSNPSAKEIPKTNVPNAPPATNEGSSGRGAEATTLNASARWSPPEPFVDPAVFSPGGQYWVEYDITPYVRQFEPADRPEQAIRQWIQQETRSRDWSNDVATLSVTPQRVRVYHHARVQQQVADVLGRFLNYLPGQFRCRVRILNVRNVSWRRDFQAGSQFLATSQPGRQAWLVTNAEAQRLVSKWGDASLLADSRVLVGNGQPVTVGWTAEPAKGAPPNGYVRNVSLDLQKEKLYSSKVGYRAETTETADGVTLRFSALVAPDAAGVDMDVHLSAKKLTRVQKVKLSVPGRPPAVEVPMVHDPSLAERFALPFDRQLLLSLGLMPSFDGKKSFLGREVDAEVLVLLELLPDPTNRVQAGPESPPPLPDTRAVSPRASPQPGPTVPTTPNGGVNPTVAPGAPSASTTPTTTNVSKPTVGPSSALAGAARATPNSKNP